MPQNLDDQTRTVILTVTTIIALPLLTINLYLQYGILARTKLGHNPSGSGSSSSSASPSSLLKGCLASLVLMMSASYIATGALLWIERILSSRDDDENTPPQEIVLTSSINFCEPDFQDSQYVAEPANAVSSLATFCPLAILGFSKMPHQPRLPWRFVLAYGSLFVIGVGSFCLHAFLTATSQGGDELPMLWYVAIMGFIAMDCILVNQRNYYKQQHSTTTTINSETTNNNNDDDNKSKNSARLVYFCTISAILATLAYVGNRHNFVFFWIMFTTYSLMLIGSILMIGLSFGAAAASANLNNENSDTIRVPILLPVMNSMLWLFFIAVGSWMLEMLCCRDILTSPDSNPVVRLVWERVVHPLWHATIGLVAFMIIQFSLVAHGTQQQDWGEPQFQWYGAPYVIFSQTKRH